MGNGGGTIRKNDKPAYLAPISGDAATALVTVGNATVSRMDLAPGYYLCWAPAGTAADTFRMRRLAADHVAVVGDCTLPPAAASGQTTVSGLAIAPGDATFEILVPDPAQAYWAIMWDGAADVQLNCTRIF